MLARPAIITRRALLSGAAAMALAPRELRAASAAGWDGANTAAGLTLSSNVAFGANCLVRQPSTAATWLTTRSLTGKSSGKWIAYFVAREQSGVNQDVGNNVGICNAGATLTNQIGFDGTHSYGVDSDGTVNYNGSAIYNFGTTWLNRGGELVAISIDLTASPARGWMRRVGGGGGSPNNNDSGWLSFAGVAGDPTNATTGTDISALGTPIYFAASQSFASGNPSSTLIFTGGWPALTQLIPIPTGFGEVDANYPYSIPAGSYTLSNNSNPTNITVSQNNMRASCTSGSGGSGYVNTSNTPAGTKKMTAAYWEMVCAGSSYVSHLIVTSTSQLIRWNNDGTTANLGGATWGSFLAGDSTYLLYDDVNKKVWGTKDGVTYYGNGGASPNPFTNTNGADVSAVGGIGSGAAFGLYFGTDRRGSGTFNAGKLADTTITLSGGFQWLGQGGVARGREVLLP